MLELEYYDRSSAFYALWNYRKASVTSKLTWAYVPILLYYIDLRIHSITSLYISLTVISYYIMVFDVTQSETAVAVHNSTDNGNILIGHESLGLPLPTAVRFSPFEAEAHRTSGYRDNLK